MQDPLRTLYAAYERECRVDPPELLERRRSAFVQEFSPERMRGALGERELLSLVHGRGPRDGLFYQLEYGEMGLGFGSIAGGSSLKFHVYRSGNSGWVRRGGSRHPVACSEREALKITTGLMKQFVQAVEWTEELHLTSGQRDAWAEFQRRVDERRLGDSVAALELGWMHKYLAMVKPRLFSFHHTKEQLARHMVRLLERPESDRFVLDWQWRRITRKLPPQWYPALITNAAYSPSAFGTGSRYWRIETQDEHGDHWPAMQKGVISLGWGEVGDLAESLELSSGGWANRRLRDIIRSTERTASAREAAVARQLWLFYAEMQPEDRVLAMQGDTILGIGKIESEYTFVADEERPHSRGVAWLDLNKWKMEKAPRTKAVIFDASDHYDLTLYAEQRLAVANSAYIRALREPPARIETPLTAIEARIEDVLKRKGQVILHGPPGTGKTYHAFRTAQELMARACFDRRSWANLDQREKDTVRARITSCTFHPAFGYEDFLEGYKPSAQGATKSFELCDGIFYEACEAAKGDTKPWVLIVDEINRGNIPAIFGELITLIEADKRGTLEWRLPLSRRSFSVPKNLWIIGTMNTADRSISLLDAALRRRFGFVELMPDVERLDCKIDELHLGNLLALLNAGIRRHVPRNARELQIGHAYFMPGGKPLETKRELQAIMRDDVFPLLAEYCFENYEALAEILGEEIVNAPGQTLNNAVIDAADRLHLALRALVAQNSDETPAEEPPDAEDEE